MTRPHSVCWIAAATAMVVLLSPSPASVLTAEPLDFSRPAVIPCSGAFDPASGPWVVERMLVPYPNEIAPHHLPAFARRFAGLRPAPAPAPADPTPAPVASAPADPAVGPWAIERLLCPYPTTVALDQLPELARRPALPAATPAGQLPGPVDSALGPWRVEQFVCAYQITVAPQRLPKAAEQLARPMPNAAKFDPAVGPWRVERLLFPYPPNIEPQRLSQVPELVAKPRPAPATVDPALGPWPVERLLFPYPATVAPQRLREFAAGDAEPLRRAAADAAEKPAHTRLVMRVAGTARRLLTLVDRGAAAARKAIQGLSRPLTPTLGGEAATPDQGGQAMSTQTDDAAEGRQQPIEALDAFAPLPAFWPHDDGGNFQVPWREAPQTASDPFAFERRWTDADAELSLAPQAVMPPGDPSRPQPVAGLDRIFGQSTGVAFLAALLLVPASCTYAAGAVYGHARDRPRRRR